MGGKNTKERVLEAEQRDRQLIGLMFSGMTARQAGAAMTPILSGSYVNIRIYERRKQGWNVPGREGWAKVDWDLAKSLKDEGVENDRIAEFFDVDRRTIEYGSINSAKPRRSSVARDRLRSHRRTSSGIPTSRK